MRLAIGFALLSMCSGSFAGPTLPSTLCEKTEIIRFNCKIKDSQKLVSVCSSPDLSSEDGYIQYRFGKPRTIELEFPASRQRTQEKFTWHWQHPYRSFIKELSFNNGAYIYSVFSYSIGPQSDDDADEGFQTYRVRINKKTSPTIKYKEFLCASQPTGDFESFFDILPNKESD